MSKVSIGYVEDELVRAGIKHDGYGDGVIHIFYLNEDGLKRWMLLHEVTSGIINCHVDKEEDDFETDRSYSVDLDNINSVFSYIYNKVGKGKFCNSDWDI